MKKKITISYFILCSILGVTQIPPGYYDDAIGLEKEALRTALHNIIRGHSEQSYKSLHTHYTTTDDKSNGDVWDMYSDEPGGTPAYSFEFITEKCGNYSKEGDCYNREHSFPQSWFNSQSPMQSDLFHVYPTDGYVNGRRASFPYGDVAVATWTSTNGSRLGTSAVNGYTGTVFEPIDEYKGDFARTYFYMVTRYKDIASGFNSEMLTGDNLSTWAIDMLLTWSDNDPVSTKEIDRNNAIYNIQNNRNPYIDDPQYIDLVWGDGVLAINEKYSLTDIRFFNNQLVISDNKELNASLKIFSLQGQELINYTISEENTTVNLKLNKGFYLASIGGNSIKFIVN